MKWKAFTYICLTIALLFVVVGCSSQGDSSKGKVELTLWYWNRSIDDNLLNQVNKQFPNVNLKVEKIGGDFKAKLMSAFAAGSGAPDIVGLNEWVADFFPSKEQFVNLYDNGSKELEPLYLDWKWKKAVTPDGQYQIALPMDTGPTALFYREDLFREAGLPTDPKEVSEILKTWDDYIAAGQQLKDAFHGKVYMFDNISTVYIQMMSQSDKIYFDHADNFIGDQAHMKHIWDTAVKVSEMGLNANISNWTAEWSAAMNKGDVASFVGAVWMKQILMEGAPDTAGKWRIARAPGGDGNNGGSFIGVTKQSKHPKEAYEVMKWLMNPENQLKSLGTMNLFPSTPGIYQDPQMTQPDPFFGNQRTNEIFIEAAKNVKESYFGPKYSIANSIFQEELSTVEKKIKSSEQAWQDILQRVQKELLLY